MSNTIAERSHVDVSHDTEKGTEGQIANGSTNAGKEANNADFVDFDGPDDQLNPLNWTYAYKWGIVWLLSSMTLIVWV